MQSLHYDRHKPVASSRTYIHFSLRVLCENGPWLQIFEAVHSFLPTYTLLFLAWFLVSFY